MNFAINLVNTRITSYYEALKSANCRPEDAFEDFVKLLQHYLDNILYRSGFVTSVVSINQKLPLIPNLHLKSVCMEILGNTMPMVLEWLSTSDLVEY